MGGCRCTYKNCTLRTDGVTHMFHYPVFDKVRCHQWLTNAQKLEFLNLKVSQLKNRVVCQHHFKDDNFMNFLKDKLTFDAVPTEDGPYCDSSQFSGRNTAQDNTKLYTISLDDIENEYLTFNEKKANFPVKYGDFLTNCDLMDLDSLNLTNDNTQIIMKDENFEGQCDNILNDNMDRRNTVALKPLLNVTLDTMLPNSNNVYTIQMTQVPVDHEFNAPSFVGPSTTTENNFKVLTHRPIELTKKNESKSLLKERRVIVINEQKITEPLPFPEKLQTVCPSIVLPLPNKRKNLNINQTDSYIKNSNNNSMYVAPNLGITNSILKQPIIETRIDIENNENNAKSDEILHNIHYETQPQNPNVESSTGTINIATPIEPQKVTNSVSENTTSKLLLKNRIPPERIAAIEKKRKFNMKLRDIIATCLDKLDDDEDKTCKRKLNSKIKKNITKKVASHLATKPELPTVQDYAVAYLEARMKKMETILLTKIDQNSQRINELKHSITPAPDKKAIHTQTTISEEIQKKQLYQEISKYLSPEANSLLYEELFINKNINKTPKKKRKHR